MNYITHHTEGINQSVYFINSEKPIVIKIVKNDQKGQRELFITNLLVGSDIIPPETQVYYYDPITGNLDDLFNQYLETLDLKIFNVCTKFNEIKEKDLQSLPGIFFILSKKLTGNIEHIIKYTDPRPNPLNKTNIKIKLSEKELNKLYKTILLQILNLLNILHNKYFIYHGDIKFENFIYQELVFPENRTLYFTDSFNKDFTIDIETHFNIYITDFEWSYPVTCGKDGSKLAPEYFLPDELNENLRVIVPKLTNDPNSIYRFGNLYHALDVIPRNGKTISEMYNVYPRVFTLDVLTLVGFVCILYNKFPKPFQPIFNNYFSKFVEIANNDKNIIKRGSVDYYTVSDTYFARYLDLNI